MSQTESLKSLQLVSVRWWNASAYYGISLADALNRQGFPAIVAGRAGSPPLQKAQDWQLPTFTEINLESLNPAKMPGNLNALKTLIRDQQIPLINAHRPEDMAFAVLVKKLSPTKIPVIRTVSDVRPPKRRFLNKYLHQNIDFFIFSCRASYERYQSVWPIFAERSAVIYSAIDTENFRPLPHYPELRRKLGILDDQLLIGIIARLDPVKDHDTFLKAAKTVAAEIPEARFLIAGEVCNITWEMLDAAAKSLGIRDKLVFVPRDDAISARDLIGSLDIGVVASNGSEVICRIAVEYMAMGKPIVSTDINVLPEIVEDGKNGLICNAGNAAQMTAHLLQLGKNSELRQNIGETGRQFAETKFSYPAFVSQTTEVYRQVLDRFSRR